MRCSESTGGVKVVTCRKPMGAGTEDSGRRRTLSVPRTSHQVQTDKYFNHCRRYTLPSCATRATRNLLKEVNKITSSSQSLRALPSYCQNLVGVCCDPVGILVYARLNDYFFVSCVSQQSKGRNLMLPLRRQPSIPGSSAPFSVMIARFPAWPSLRNDSPIPAIVVVGLSSLIRPHFW